MGERLTSNGEIHIVDDDPAVLDALSIVFTLEGFQVTGFAVQEGAQVLIGKAHFVVVSAQAWACSAATAFLISSSQ